MSVGRNFVFEFLPAGFFARLTVRLLHLTKQEELWADCIIVILGDAKGGQRSKRVFSHLNFFFVVPARVALSGMAVEVMVLSQSYNDDLLKLLKLTISSLESLAEEFFQIRATTTIPCVHCLKQRNDKPFLFDLAACEQAAGDGQS